jgi:hypothetical protein
MHFVRAQVFGSKKLSTSFSIFAPQAETDFSCHGRAGALIWGARNGDFTKPYEVVALWEAICRPMEWVGF